MTDATASDYLDPRQHPGKAPPPPVAVVPGAAITEPSDPARSHDPARSPDTQRSPGVQQGPDARRSPDAPLTTVDGTPLKVALGVATRRARWRAFALVAPLLLFVIVTFAAPIAQMLVRSVHNDAFSANMPDLSAWFAANPPTGEIPGEGAFAALRDDLVLARDNRTIGTVGTRINYDYPGASSMFRSDSRAAGRWEAPYKEKFIEEDADWGDPALWQSMRAASSAWTGNFYLAAVDLERGIDGSIQRVPDNRAIYVSLFLKTFALSGLITGLCFILGFPVAHLLANLPARYANLLMICVLLPFWTSLLVRTTAWIAMLQSQGVVNDTLVATSIIDDGSRVQMIYNEIGTVVAMTHILLPFMILPLYSVMKTIPPSYVRAARSLGATSWTAFWRVYFPQTVPGIGAGVLLVFILAVGYYITPALVGGASGQLISNLIAFHMQRSLNWSLAAALSAILLASVLVLYWLYDRIVGIDNMKLG